MRELLCLLFLLGKARSLCLMIMMLYWQQANTSFKLLVAYVFFLRNSMINSRWSSSGAPTWVGPNYIFKNPLYYPSPEHCRSPSDSLSRYNCVTSILLYLFEASSFKLKELKQAKIMMMLRMPVRGMHHCSAPSSASIFLTSLHGIKRLSSS